jgi:hypothetical protein
VNQPAGHTSERDFQRAVVTLASLKRWCAYHTHDSRGSMAGFPDLVLVRDRVVFAELKTATGRVRPAQADWQARLRDAGAETYVWRPASWHQIEQVLA